LAISRNEKILGEVLIQRHATLTNVENTQFWEQK